MPHVDSLSRETGETAFAVHYSQGDVAYLYDCVSSRDVRLGERTEMRTAPWSHVAGTAILAFRDEAAVLDELRAARNTNKDGLPTVEAFRRELARVRRQGYAVHRDAEKCLIAAPILGPSQPVSAALMVGGPAFRVKPATQRKLARIVIRHADRVSRDVGS
jgi:DNA-binding IclR family transcriptional regulator